MGNLFYWLSCIVIVAVVISGTFFFLLWLISRKAKRCNVYYLSPDDGEDDGTNIANDSDCDMEETFDPFDSFIHD